jgi:virulence factor Mce-like protein
VELNGVKVGEVQQVDSKDGHALLKLTLQKQYANLLHADATAKVEPHGLLGPKFVSLEGGKKGQLKENAVIPLSRTQVGTDFDQLLNTFQPDVRDNLKVTLDELGNASRNRGDDMNDAFKALGQSSDNLATVTATLKRRDQDLADFIVASETLNADMQNAPISDNIRHTDEVLSGLVPVEDHIGGSIDHTAGVMRKVNVAMNGNGGNLAYVLSKLPALVTRLRTLLQAGTSITNGVNPALPDLMTAVWETEDAFSGRDANGHYVRVFAISGSCSTPAVVPDSTCASPNGASDVYGNRSAARTSPSPSSPSGMAPPTDRELSAMFLGG